MQRYLQLSKSPVKFYLQFQTPLTSCDTRAKSCSDLTGTDPVLRNLTELCNSLGVADSTSTSALDSALPQSEGDGALFDQQLIDCLKPGSFLNVSNLPSEFVTFKLFLVVLAMVIEVIYFCWFHSLYC